VLVTAQSADMRNTATDNCRDPGPVIPQPTVQNRASAIEFTGKLYDVMKRGDAAASGVATGVRAAPGGTC